MSFYLNHLHKLHLPCGSESTSALTEENFKVQGGFESLMAGVQSGSTDIFLWEVFTTKPWFDSGDLKYVSPPRSLTPLTPTVDWRSEHSLASFFFCREL